MAEVLYGPWLVTVGPFYPYFGHLFRIFGSDNADGTYRSNSRPIDVTGGRWSINIELLGLDPGPGPTSRRNLARPTIRVTDFTPPLGLMVTISTTGQPLMTLVCVSRDPAINPTPIANPYDFTRPDQAPQAANGLFGKLGP